MLDQVSRELTDMQPENRRRAYQKNKNRVK